MDLPERRDAYVLINAGAILLIKGLGAKAERRAQEILVPSVCMYALYEFGRLPLQRFVSSDGRDRSKPQWDV